MPTPSTASMTMMIMVVVVVMIIGAQINGHQVTRGTKFCTMSPNIYKFAIWALFNATLLALRILRSTLNFWRIRTLLVMMMMMMMMIVVFIVRNNVTLMTVLTGCGGNVVCVW
jgi:hypothetical protein